MTITIIKKDEPREIKNITITIFSEPGIGKTTLANTASNPLLLDFDLESHRAEARADTVQVKKWSDIKDMTAADCGDYDTIIIDTAGQAVERLIEQIVESNPRLKTATGSLIPHGYTLVKKEFKFWLNKIKGYGKDIVIVAHSEEDKQGDETKIRLEMVKSAKAEVYRKSDQMGFLHMKEGQRVIDFDPTEINFGKNAGKMKTVIVRDVEKEPGQLAEIIEQIKIAINKKLEATGEIAEQIKDLKSEALANKGDIEWINAMTAESKDAPRSIKRVLMDIATGQGFIYNKESGEWERPEGQEPEEVQEDEKDAIAEQLNKEWGEQKNDKGRKEIHAKAKVLGYKFVAGKKHYIKA